jgi:hypothetical protein
MFGQMWRKNKHERPNSLTIKRLRITRVSFPLVFGCMNRDKNLFYPKEGAYHRSIQYEL